MPSFHQTSLSSSPSAQSTLLTSTPTPVRTGRGLVTWKPIAIFVLMIIVSAEAQTFQYSRGWTNGKRNGGPVFGAQSALGSGPYDLENGYYGIDNLDAIIPPGHLQMNLGPQGRFRSIDYNQYLAKRMSLSGSGTVNSRKQPLWFGTILGVDGADSTSAGSSTSNSNSNSPASRSTSSADF